MGFNRTPKSLARFLIDSADLPSSTASRARLIFGASWRSISSSSGDHSFFCSTFIATWLSNLFPQNDGSPPHVVVPSEALDNQQG